MQQHDLSTILVDSAEDAKQALVGEPLSVRLTRIGVPAQTAGMLPVDVVWSVDGQPCMFDIKTSSDLIASVDDGRLHSQMDSMQRASCFMFGFVIEGPHSADDYTVGYGPRAWPVERFDDLLVSLQSEGARIALSTRVNRTPQRLAALYRYSGKTEHGSYHAPQPHHVLHNLYTDITYRRQVELLMSLPDLGETKANALLDRYPLTDILGMSELDEALKRWLGLKGIGPKVAATWLTFLREDFSSPLLRSKS